MSGVIVHEWLSRTGGSENVFEELSAIYPSAARFCLWNESGGRFTDVGETFLARTPLRGRKAAALPLMPAAWRTLPRVEADWILCSTHLFAHHARFRDSADVPKLAYVHTPARYLWVPELDGRGNGIATRAVASAFKPLDRRRAQEPVALAANSRFVKERIAQTWRRDDATVIYPPVRVDDFVSASDADLAPADAAVLATLPEDFVFGFSRFIPYKRLEMAILAGVAADAPVVLAGEGPDEPRLRAIAAEHPGRVTFVGRPSFPLLTALYRRARVVVFPAVEDFGIVPVEAMASGTPVLVNPVGGAAESVIEGRTGAVLRGDSRSELREAIALSDAATAADCVARARAFDVTVFAREIREWVEKEVDRHG